MRDMKTVLRGAASSCALELASRPGWTGPLNAAMRAANPMPLSLGTANFARPVEKAIAQMQEHLRAKAEDLVGDMWARGTTFGLRLFADTTDALRREMELGRTETNESCLASNIPAILARYHFAGEAISTVHALASTGAATAVGLTHWNAARAAYAGEIVKFVGLILIDSAEVLELAEVPDEWIDDLSDVVLAFVFPGAGENPKSEAWRQERAEQLGAIWLMVRARQGWDAP